MTGQHATAKLLGALSRLLTEVRAAPLHLKTDGHAEAQRLHSEVTDQLADYVVPRLVQLEAPLLTVVGGSTGAGKSTLVNSIVGEPVTESGVLRPTTRSPVLVHHPEEGHWFAPDRILPELQRSSEHGNTTYGLRLVATPRMPRGLAVLDAPDVDSIDRGNRELAAQLLAAADLWLFVTSAARYADQVPWDYLRQAAERSTSVAVILDRTSHEAVIEVRGHLARMMTARGLSDSPLFTVPESEVDDRGLLPEDAVEAIVSWLHDLAGDPASRRMVISQTLDGAVRHNVLRSHDIADALDEQIEAATHLVDAVTTRYQQAVEAVARETVDGTMLRGEIVARWQEFVGNGEILKSVEDKVGRIRDRLVDGVTGKRTRTDDVAAAIEQGLHILLLEHAEAAAEAVGRSWGSTSAGRALLDEHRGLDRASRDMRARAERVARDWQQFVLELVRAEGADKRRTAKFLAFGVNGVGVALMVVTFASAAGASGGSTTVIGHKLLEAIFGQAAVDTLVTRAHDDLVQRMTDALELESHRYLSLVSSPDRLLEAQSAVRDAARQAEYARHSEFVEEGLMNEEPDE